MASAILIVAAICIVPLVAVRIIMGWVMPATTIAAFDTGLTRLFKIVFQISVVALGGLIVYAFYIGNR